MKHFIDEDYDSTEEYESNLLHHADDYKDGDYYEKQELSDRFGDWIQNELDLQPDSRF